MNFKKSHFEIHSRFRNGIFILTIIIFLTLLGFYYYPRPLRSEQGFAELVTFRKQIDSIKKCSEEQIKGYRLQPFNPNFISDHKGYVLGLSPEELDRLYKYRSDGKWVNSIADFKKVTEVSDSLLTVISPLFKFPEWKKKFKKRKYPVKRYPVKTYAQKEDLNAVSTKELVETIRIPDFVASRIVKYRNRIGGFIGDVQLKDVYGLYDHQRKKILSIFTVKTPKKVKKININKASVKELLTVPYFDFEMALEIKDFVKGRGGISNFNELGEIDSFSLEKIDRIKLYLTLN